MKLVLMSTPQFFVEEHQILTALFDEGLELVHLNKPNSEPVFYERLLSLLPKEAAGPKGPLLASMVPKLQFLLEFR